MENIFWILAAIVVVGAIIWYLKGTKKGPTPMKEPKEPAPSPPPETPETPETPTT